MTEKTSDRAFAMLAALKRLVAFALHPSRWWLVPLVGLVAVVALVTGMVMCNIIDDNFDDRAGPTQANQSRAVAMAAHLVFREVDGNKWVANDPFYLPSHWLNDMPSFQQGIVAACARFARIMADASDTGQGSAPELERAAGLLKYPGTVWKFDPSTSWAPTASSEKQYRNAARSLEEYNRRLGEGDPGLDRDAPTLATLVASLGHELGGLSTNIDLYLGEGHPALFNGTSDDLFYRTKGTVYGYGMIVRELGWDYAPLLAERNLGAQWRLMVDSLRSAATLRPVVVMNGAPDGMLWSNHLLAEGFYLLRARAQLSEIAETLAQ